MKLSEKQTWHLAYALLFLLAVVLCLRLVREPDLWWQLRTGEYILEHKTVPDTDVFSFTYEGKPWLNVKWVFEVIQAILVKNFGEAFLPLTQIVANILLLLTLLLTFRQFGTLFKISRFAKFCTLILILIGLSYRMNGRPELTTYLFTAVYLLIFMLYSRGKTKWLFALIPLQIIWANLHEAYGVGMVMMLIFLASNWFISFTQKIKSAKFKRDRIVQTIIILVALFAVMIHPSGTRMLFHPYEIFTQLDQNQFTTEIFGAHKKEYWQMPAYVSLIFLAISALQIWRIGKPKGKFKLNSILEKVPLFYILLYAAFFYLSLKSFRNIPFFLLVASPLVAITFSAFTSKLSQKASVGVAIIVSVIFYLSIVTNTFYKTFLPAEVYGLGINPHKNPLGAARFIKDNKISGNGFTDYFGSSFLLWKLQPDFKTFMDLRDLDVFEADDMEIALTCCTNPERPLSDHRPVWEVISSYYNFNYVAIINHPQFQNLHLYLIQHNDFELVYGDELMSVYLKIKPENEQLIAKYGFKKNGDVYHEIEKMEISDKAFFVNRAFWPVYKIDSHTAVEQTLMRQAYYSYLGIQPK